MYGIPGFGGEDESAFTALTASDALAVGAEVFGVAASRAVRLDTERDDSFRLSVGDGTDVVLKVAHPADSAELIDLQTGALQHAAQADPSLPLQRMLPSNGDDFAPTLPQHDHRIARAFLWMDGTELEHARPDDRQLGELGNALGHLSLALRDFEHPSGDRVNAWDLQRLPMLRTTLEHPSFAHSRRRLAEKALDRYDERVTVRLDDLPRQIIHNDFNPGNVLVDDATRAYVVGILDFGDAVRSFRIADLAVAISYQLFPLGRTVQTVQPMIDGFEAIVPLERAEREVLWELVIARLAQRVILSDWLSIEGDDRGRNEATRAQVADVLHGLMSSV